MPPETPRAESLRDITGSTHHIVRVAVVQLAYHPAVHGSLADPFGKYDPQGKLSPSILPAGDMTVPAALRDAHQTLSARVESAYLKQLTRKLRAVLQACRAWNVRLVVFPEYSVPAPVLEAVAEAAGDMVVVAGSCFVDRAVRRNPAYERLHAPTRPGLRQNVVPVIHRSRIVQLVAKLQATKPERSLEMVPAESWEPVSLPDDFGGPLGVLNCLDFLARTLTAYGEQVTPKLNQCRLLAVPALTPADSLPLFRGHQIEESGPGRRPVLFANHAPGGGSTIVAGERVAEDLNAFPVHAGVLEKHHEEGVLVSDLDLAVVGVGKEGRYGEALRCEPFAAASLVYSGTSPALTTWLAGLRDVLPEISTDADEGDALDRAVAWIGENPPPRGGATPMQMRRWDRLLQNLEHESSLEGLRRLTREVVLSPNVLPLTGVEKALARGAGRTIRAWVKGEHEGAAPFATVGEKLLEDARAGETQRATWTDAARRTWADIADAVYGVAAQPVSSISSPLDRATETVESQVVKAALDDGNAHAEAGRYAEARADFERALAEAQRQGAANEVHGDKWREWAARAAIGAAACAGNLEDGAGARALLEQIPMEGLDATRRIRVANLWAAQGEVERARALLPPVPSLSEDLAKEALEVGQRIELVEGRVPTDEILSPSPDITLLAASVLMELEPPDASRAARLAHRVLHSRADNPLIRAEALRVLLRAILCTAHELPPSVVGIAENDRPGIVASIEATAPEVLGSQIPEAMRRSVLGLWGNFLELTNDRDALERLPEISTDDSKEEEWSYRTAARTAERLAQEGHVEAALQVLPPDDHPWRGRLVQVDVLRVAGQEDRALSQALSLAGELPGRARIEMTASALLSRCGRHAEALVYAQRAADALPARGLRLRLAECLLALRRASEAWKILADDEPSAGPRVVRTLAMIADRAHPERALELWQRYLALQPGDAAIRVHVTGILFAQNRGEEAAQEAWATFERHGDMLSPEQLFKLGGLQGSPLPEVERKRRVQAIAATIQRRFPADPAAEHARLSLLMTAGALDTSAQRIDFTLLREAGRVQAMSTAQVIELMRAQGQMTHLVQQLGKRGALPVALFCGAVAPPVAVPLVVARMFHRDRVEVCFSAPVGLQDVPPEFHFEGADLLVSEVELYLLSALRLLDTVRARLGPRGRIHLFRGAWTRIVEDHGALRAQAETRRGERLDKTVAALARLPRLAPGQGETGVSDAQIALRRGGMVLTSPADAELHAAGVVPDGVPEGRRLSPLTALQWLREQGCISETVLNALLPYFKLDSETPRPDPIPLPLLVSGYFLEKLCEHEALRDFLRVFPAVHIGESDWQALLARQREGIEEAEAADLAERVHAWVADGMRSGWVQILQDPEIEGLPPLLDPENDIAVRLVKEPLEWTASYADGLAVHPAWWRLSADFFGSTAPLAAEMVPLLKWDDREPEARGLVRRLRAGHERHLSLPAVVRALLSGPAEEPTRQRMLWKLAELGFPDALGAEEIVALSREYGGLDGAVARRVLDRLEWMARETGHLGGDTARLRLASAYAAAVFRAFCGKPASTLQDGEAVGALTGSDASLPLAEAAALGRSLLGRAETLTQSTRTDFLDSMVRFLAASAASAPRLAWERDLDNKGWSRRIDGPLPALWDFVRSWAGTDGQRRAAYDRGVREAWLFLDLSGDDEVRIRVMGAALDHAVEGQHARGQLLFTDLAIEAETILSALWTWRPTAVRGIDLSGPGLAGAVTVFDEDVLALGAQPGTELEEAGAGRFMTYLFPVPNSSRGMRVFAPAEAILLRQSFEEAESFAGRLKLFQGSHDGRAYRLLDGLQRHPSRVSLRRAVARRAVSALWRAVRDDPAYLVHWPRSRGLGAFGARPSLHELRAMLSEPQELEAAGEHLGATLFQRGDDEKGLWRNRDDVGDLLKTAFEVPGGLVFGPVMSMLANGYEAHVDDALAILEQSENHPIARVARSILLLRAGAARKPVLKLPSGKGIDLREKLPEVLRQVLDRTAAEPATDTLAAAEPALVRVCLQVVLDLAGPKPLSRREGLWLTYRLFQWLCAQLDAISPDARIAGLRHLVALSPRPGPPLDRLDPRGFGRDLFDHRLGTVLYALGAMQEPAFLVDRVPASPKEIPYRLAWQPAMVEVLANLASRLDGSPGLGSELDWSAPDNIADLAFVALLRIDPNAFARVPEIARLARLRRLPAEPDTMDQTAQSLFLPLVMQAALHAAALSEEERRLLLEKIRTVKPGEIANRWRLQVLPSLFGQGSADVPEAEALLALQNKLDDQLSPMALAFLLFGVAARDPSRVGMVLRDVISEAERRGVDPVPLAAGVGRVARFVEEPMRSSVTEILRDLASRPPFQGDERMRELMVIFAETSAAHPEPSSSR